MNFLFLAVNSKCARETPANLKHEIQGGQCGLMLYVCYPMNQRVGRKSRKHTGVSSGFSGIEKVEKTTADKVKFFKFWREIKINEKFTNFL